MNRDLVVPGVLFSERFLYGLDGLKRNRYLYI